IPFEVERLVHGDQDRSHTVRARHHDDPSDVSGVLNQSLPHSHQLRLAPRVDAELARAVFTRDLADTGVYAQVHERPGQDAGQLRSAFPDQATAASVLNPFRPDVSSPDRSAETFPPDRITPARRPEASSAPHSRAATPTAPLGSTTPFIRSNRKAMARTISSS